MVISLVIVTFLVVVLLILVDGMHPTSSSLSVFELERRSHHSKQALHELHRQEVLGDILSLIRVMSAVLLVAVVLLSIATFGWLIGAIVGIVIALEYGAVARLGLLQRQSHKLYDMLEPSLLTFIDKAPFVLSLLRNIPHDSLRTNRKIDSREEFQHLIDTSVDMLTPDEKKLIINGLSFDTRLVRTIMTPKRSIDSIKKSEFLGPLTLDELHKTGHSRLPVIDGDIDHVIGILHLQSLLALDIKRSVTAEKAMEPRVLYIREDQTLGHALAAFLRTHHHLFIVVNELRETVGLVTLTDIIEALLGRKIIDEFDAHDDLRQVAQRHPHDNVPTPHQEI